jgi:hypothetical protein
MIPKLRTGLPLSALAAMLLALFAADNLLLLAFLGLSPLLTLLAVLTVCPLVAALVARAIRTDITVPWRGIAIAGLIALCLFLLGGQGRFFYANPDWQIRDAILADLTKNSWPFAYLVEEKPAILRAPIGLYLLPSLAGTGWNEIAMLLSNSIRLSLIVALCWPLFAQNRDRFIALAIFLFFSGLDIVGTAAFSHLGVDVSWDHLERWNFNNQYSAHITQVFWVPQHAMAGWLCAVAFLLWQRGHASIGLFAAAIPLVALWSPLAIMGAVPFALLAGVSVLKNGDWTARDISIAAVSLALALPALWYLKIDAVSLGSSFRPIAALAYILLICLEVLPFIIALLLSAQSDVRDRILIWLVFACLLVMPFYQIGINSDFQMRASIMPLALLALLFGQWFARLVASWKLFPMAVTSVVLLLSVGAVTPFMEIRRALLNGPSPAPLCSLVGVWDKQKDAIVAPYATYFAYVDQLPAFMRGQAVLAGTQDPDICWSKPWVMPETIAPAEEKNGSE